MLVEHHRRQQNQPASPLRLPAQLGHRDHCGPPGQHRVRLADRDRVRDTAQHRVPAPRPHPDPADRAADDAASSSTGEIDLSVASVAGLRQRVVGLAVERRHADGDHHPAVPRRSASCAVRSTASSSRVLGLPSLAVTIGTLALYRGLAVRGARRPGGHRASRGHHHRPAGEDRRHRHPGLDSSGRRCSPSSSASSCTSPASAAPCSPSATTTRRPASPESASRGPSSGCSSSPVRSPRSPACSWTLRYGSARGDNGTGLELSVIAAVLLGGVSIFGGKGTLPGVIAGVGAARRSCATRCSWPASPKTRCPSSPAAS